LGIVLVLVVVLVLDSVGFRTWKRARFSRNNLVPLFNGEILGFSRTKDDDEREDDLLTSAFGFKGALAPIFHNAGANRELNFR